MKSGVSNRKNRRQLVLMGGALALIVITALGWRFYNDLQIRKVSSFEECQKSPGSTLQASYPATCVTRDGKHFPGPRVAPPGPAPGTKVSTVDIKEFRVRLQVNAPDAYYMIDKDGNAYISTTELEGLRKQIQGCTSGLHGITIDKNLQEVLQIEPACAVETTETTMRIFAIQQSIRDALKFPANL